MARRVYSADEKAQALALYQEQGPTEVLKQLGIPKGTIAGWAREAGYGTVRNEVTAAAVEAHRLDAEARRLALAEAFLGIAELAVKRERELIATSGLRDVVGAGTRAIHDTLLLTGEATSRSEVISVDAITAEIQKLEAELGAA